MHRGFVPWCHIFLTAVLLAAVLSCGLVNLPDEYSRGNPWDPDLSASVTFQHRFPFFEDRSFIHPRDIQLSFDGRYLAVISEPRGHLEIYDTQNSMVPLNIDGLFHNDFQDLAFNGSGILYAINWGGVVRINCTTRQADERMLNWDYGAPMNMRLITIDPDPLNNNFYIYASLDGYANAFVAEYTSWENFPDTYNVLLTHSGSEFQISDIAAASDSLYFVTDEFSGQFSINQWDVAADTFVKRLFYDSAASGWASDTAGFGSAASNGFQPMDLDIGNGYLYAFSSGDQASAVIRTSLSLDPVQTLEWTAQNGTDFTESRQYKAYNIASDPGDIDAVYVAANVRWSVPAQNRITRHLRTQSGIDLELPGRDFDTGELIESRDFIHRGGVSYILDIQRAAILRSDNDFNTITVIGEDVLNPYEARAMTVSDTAVYVADYDYSTGSDVVKEFDSSGSYVGELNFLSAPVNPINEILILDDGRLLIWSPSINNQISIFEDTGSGWDLDTEGPVILTAANAENLKLVQGSDGILYAGYEYNTQGPADSTVSRHSIVDFADIDNLNTVIRGFDTADNSYFSYIPEDWNTDTGRFGFVDLTVSSGGFAWILVERSILLRLSPVSVSEARGFGYLGCLADRNGPSYISEYPLPHANGIRGMNQIAAASDTAVRGVSGWDGIALEIGQ